MAASVAELDNTVRAFYEGRGDTQKQAGHALNQFKENPDSWLLVDQILQESNNPQTKFLGLQVLDNVIMTKWKILPRDQCMGIRNFIVNFIIQSSSSEESLRQHRALLNKLNLVLISILKQEWPDNWPHFINEIISASNSSLPICENNMAILRLLSEEVFDYSAEQMTSQKTRSLKDTMCSQFSDIFKLCQSVLRTADSVSLLRATLETLLRFLNWIPLGYVFETDIIDIIQGKFLRPPETRNIALKCLTEIAGLAIGPQFQYDAKLVQMFTDTLTTIAEIIPPSLDLRAQYKKSNTRDQEFVQNLALFLCAFFSTHLNVIENLPNQEFLRHGHYYLILISKIEDREIFKICLDYWTKLVCELYDEMQQLPITDLNPLVHMNNSGLSNGGAPNPDVMKQYPLRKHKYDEILNSLRYVMIENMVRPEEVLVVENDEGEIVREFVKESDTIQLYKTTRECLVYLTHLDVVDTEQIMSEKLSKQVDNSEWSWTACNTLCWAIGSISGAMNEETEKRFLVTVIKDLLGLTEMKRGKDNKAVVASNIMYIVGQYPRFLKAHWKFLKTVVNKLFEFMHETHEGVQDMACDTFIKIASKCKRHFVALQPGETEPFIDEIVRNLRKITCDLTPQQVHTFYEACGNMINAQGQKSMQERLIADLMAMPNQAWDAIITQAQRDQTILQDADTIKVIGNIMKTNVAACTSVGSYFYPQIGRIYMDMLQMYRAASNLIDQAVKNEGVVATKMPKVRGLRTIKKEILKLINTYVDRADDFEMIHQNLVPGLLEAVLGDYRNNVPDAREAEVLNVMTSVITKLHSMMDDQIMAIMENVFECTLEMINKDFSEYPEHRVQFFNLLRAINIHCFPALLRLDGRQFKFVIDSCMWASKHDNREVETAGLNMCLELINNMAESDAQTSNTFFQNFFTTILQDVFFVLCDPDHKAGFKYQTNLLAQMFRLVDTDKIQGPIYMPETAQVGTPNRQFLREFTQSLLSNAFKNLGAKQINDFVNALFNYNSDLTKFKTEVRDFLVSMREFSASDNAELFAEDREKAAKDAQDQERQKAMKVGGLMKPADIEDDELKFGKQIQKKQLEIPEYAAAFVDYKALKKLIKELKNSPVTRPGSLVNDRPQLLDPQLALQANKAPFFFRLDRELDKVNEFYKVKEAESRVRLRVLIDKQRSMRMRNPVISKNSTHYVTLEQGFRDFIRDLSKLQQFIEINATAFSKILKKWDKTSKSQTKELYLSRAVEIQPVFNRDVISELSDQASTSLLDCAAWAEGDGTQYGGSNAEAQVMATPRLEQNEADSDLMEALNKGDIPVLRDLLSHFEPTAVTKERVTRAFLTTVSSAPEEGLNMLLKTGMVDLDRQDEINDRNCLHKSAMAGRQTFLRAALTGNVSCSKPDAYGRIPLHYASMNGHVDCIDDLIRAQPSTVDQKDLDDFTPLIHAITHSHLRSVEKILSYAAHVDPVKEGSHIPLNLACQHGSVPLVELLLRRKPQILPDAEGLYPQHLVARCGTDPQLLSLLQEYGADLDQPDKLYQWTPLFHAASEGRVDCLRTLLDSGVSISALDEKGQSALYYATWEGHLSCMAMLAPGMPKLTRDERAMTGSGALAHTDSSNLVPTAGNIEMIPDLSLPPPIIPTRRYGHNFLDSKSTVLLIFGESGNNAVTFYDESKYPAARLTITPRSADVLPRNLLLPIQEENRCVAFEMDILDTFAVDFDVFPTFGKKVLAKGSVPPEVFRNKHSSSGHHHLSLFDPRLRAVGQISFKYQVIKPFSGLGLDIMPFATYWKATSQFDSSKPSSLVTGSSLSGEYIRLSIQPSLDGVPIVYPTWTFNHAGLEVPIVHLTHRQFLSLGNHSPDRKERLKRLLTSRELTAAHKELGVSHASLVEVLAELPADVNVELHIMYPSEDQEEALKFSPLPSINDFVDAVLEIVFHHARDMRDKQAQHMRSIVFSSYNSDLCTALNWKQPNFPVLLCNDLGADVPTSPVLAPRSAEPHHDGRVDARTMSVKEAVRIATTNNFMGLVCRARLLDAVPALIEAIKVAGLVLVSDASTPTPASAPAAASGVASPPFSGVSDGIDGIMKEEGVLRFNETVDV